MEYKVLGSTGLRVSRICFGSLTMGKLQANLPLAQGSALLEYAFESGINFIDTAELYGTYKYLRQALHRFPEVVVATKSYAYTAEMMALSLEKARREIDRDYLDIFLLHEQESRLTLAGHRPALDYLLEAKARGLVRAIGVSTHTIEVTRAAATMPDIEVVHPLFNRAGIGIADGSSAAMLAAIKETAICGKGVYAMKPLAGGHLLADAQTALQYVLEVPEITAVAVGMKSEVEIDVNLAIAAGEQPPAGALRAIAKIERRLHIEEWCTGCGTCLRRCRQEALYLKGQKVAVRSEKCVFCGYCAAVCPDFCIKVF